MWLFYNILYYIGQKKLPGPGTTLTEETAEQVLLKINHMIHSNKRGILFMQFFPKPMKRRKRISKTTSSL